MENALIYYYDIYIEKINKIIDNFYFEFNNNNFIISLYNRNEVEAKEILLLNQEMIENNIPVYKIILTKFNSILFEYNKNLYILMQLPNIINKEIEWEEVLKFFYIPKQSYNYLDKSNWSMSWQNKIDYIEKQFMQFENKYPIIKESINYYIGIWENAISYYNDNVIQNNSQKVVCPKRITCNSDLFSLYNPLNLTIDYRERNLIDYIKSFLLQKKYSIYKLNTIFKVLEQQNVDVYRILSRSLFPSEYFDLYEEILINNADEKLLIKVIEKNDNYLEFLRAIFKYYSKYNIPLIKWIIKKD